MEVLDYGLDVYIHASSSGQTEMLGLQGSPVVRELQGGMVEKERLIAQRWYGR